MSKIQYVKGVGKTERMQLPITEICLCAFLVKGTIAPVVLRGKTKCPCLMLLNTRRWQKGSHSNPLLS